LTFDHYHIREVCIDDLQQYFNLIKNNREWLEDFFAGTVAITQTIEETRIHLQDVIEKAKKKNYFPFVIIDSFANALISSIQIKNLDWNIPKGELGYYIDKKYEGKGIVTKAVSLIIDFGFNELKLNKIYLRTHEENIGSRKVAEKNNFQLEGIIRNDYKTTSGNLVDLMYYGLIRN